MTFTDISTLAVSAFGLGMASGVLLGVVIRLMRSFNN